MTKDIYIRFDGEILYIKINDDIKELGQLNTHRGRILRADKLRAVMAKGEWIKLPQKAR